MGKQGEKAWSKLKHSYIMLFISPCRHVSIPFWFSCLDSFSVHPTGNSFLFENCKKKKKRHTKTHQNNYVYAYMPSKRKIPITAFTHISHCARFCVLNKD